MNTLFERFDASDEYLSGDAFTKGIGASTDDESRNENLLTQAAMALNLADDDDGIHAKKDAGDEA